MAPDDQGLIVVNVPANHQHRMISLRTGSALIPFIERCGKCDWVDPDALTRSAEQAIKSSLSARAGRIAVSVETDPFAFVQPSSGELELREILVQALAAMAHHSAVLGATGHASDGKRESAILRALEGEIGRAIRDAIWIGGES